MLSWDEPITAKPSVPMPRQAGLTGEFISSLNAGAAMLQAQQQAAMAAGRPLKLRMHVRSFDAVGHMVASGLGVAALPKGAAVPLAKAMRLEWRPLADAWATRQLQVAIRPDADATVVALRDFLLPTSQSAKPHRARFK